MLTVNIDKEDIPLVSIITPAYKCEKYIAECMDSVINQTYKNWEMIIVNDKSPDRTESIVKDYMVKDQRIKLYTQQVNEGVAAARNKAIKMSSGRFIAFLDSDDCWKPNKLERQIQFMIKNRSGFSFTEYEIMDNKSASIGKVIHVPDKISYEQYLKNTIIGCLTVVMDKEILGDIEVETGNLEDVLTWMKYLKRGYDADGLQENLASYRVSENSVSSNKIKNAKRYFICLRKHQKLSFVKSLYCEFFYIFNAIKKRL